MRYKKCKNRVKQMGFGFFWIWFLCGVLGVWFSSLRANAVSVAIYEVFLWILVFLGFDFVCGGVCVIASIAGQRAAIYEVFLWILVFFGFLFCVGVCVITSRACTAWQSKTTPSLRAQLVAHAMTFLLTSPHAMKQKPTP